MNDIIATQRIERRRVPSLLSRAATYRSDYSPLDHIKQKPAHTRRRGKKPDKRFSLPRLTIRLSPARRRALSVALVSLIALACSLLLLFLALAWRGQSITLPEDEPVLAGFSFPDAGPGRENPGEIPLDLMETFTWNFYTVRKGDSVSKIAARFGISMDAVIASNRIGNARRLQEGEKIRIPNMDGIPYTVRKGDTLLSISSAQGIPLEAILDANDIQSEAISPETVLFLPGAHMPPEDLRRALGDLFIYPIRGRLSSPFGWRRDPFTGERRYHAAVDLAANTGTPIKAAMDGRVSVVGLNSVYGKYVIISHSGGYQTMYAHMNTVSVRQGAYVNQGVKIGEVGSTGYSTGPHLHFAIYKNGRALNPLEFLHQ
jgi:murein DD-endopeptidase MepM/ murein hydrolase activator NlpD